MQQYVIGVDGGNTKTDYMLFTLHGEFVDHIRDGTCSHEAVGYEAAELILQARIKQILNRNRLTIANVEAGAFGLAGIDNRVQQNHFADIMQRIGIKKFAVDNDSFLGIVAGSSKGYGICSINGTGTVAGGIDPHGSRLQVGGIGPLVGDDAGGPYIARCGTRAVYDSFFRCGEPTVMTEAVFSLLGIKSPDELMQAICDHEDMLGSVEMTRIVFAAAGLGDIPALHIMDNVGHQLAKTSAGCALNLMFDREIEIILAGSVWVKAESPALFEAYKSYMARYLPDKTLIYHILQIPPAAGAVLWAMSLAGIDCFQPSVRQRVISAVENSLEFNGDLE